MIELMVVIALLGILSAVGAVAYRGMMEASRRSARRSDATNLVSQLNLHNSIATSAERLIVSVHPTTGEGANRGIGFTQAAPRDGVRIINSATSAPVSLNQLRAQTADVIVILEHPDPSDPANAHTAFTGFKDSHHAIAIAGDRLADILGLGIPNNDYGYRICFIEGQGRWEARTAWIDGCVAP